MLLTMYLLIDWELHHLFEASNILQYILFMVFFFMNLWKFLVKNAIAELKCSATFISITLELVGENN